MSGGVALGGVRVGCLLCPVLMNIVFVPFSEFMCIKKLRTFYVKYFIKKTAFF